MDKFVSAFLLVMICAVNSLAQINYQFIEVLSKQRVFEEASLTIESHEKKDTKDSILLAKRKIEESTLIQLVEAIRNTDLNKVNEYLSVELKKEILTIDSMLNEYENQFKGLDSIYLFENPTVSVSFYGTEGKTQFSRQNSKLLIEYQYYFDKTLRISQIKINDLVFPTSIEQVYKLATTKWEQNLSVEEKFKNYKNLLEYLEPKENEFVNDFYLPINNKYIAELYGDLSWLAIQLGKNYEALDFAKSGIVHYPEYNYIHSYLALSLAQIGEIEEAEIVYKKYKDYNYRNSYLKYKFQKDIRQLEKLGIIVTHKERIYMILKEQ